MSVQTVDNSNAIVTKALASVGEIATLPEVTAKIMQVVEDPNGTAAELHEVIKRDPALSAKVLSVVNSAFYGLPGQVANLDRAIILLGGSAVKNIAVAASLGRMFTGPRSSDDFDARGLWEHSVAVAVGARAINAAAGNVAPADEIFLAGLIHDVGLLAERQAFPDKLAEVVRRCSNGDGDFLQLEKQIVGATHQEFGDALTTNWRFPRHLRAAVGSHHNPDTLPEELRRVVTILRCADILCCQEALGFYLTARGQELTQQMFDAVGIADDQLAEARGVLAAGLAEAEAVLGSNR
jgi:HD-like signal output (HDOD) protein